MTKDRESDKGKPVQDWENQPDYYFTPQGMMVFTEAYHRKRGYCCKSGCRHCPFGFKIRN